MAAMDINQLAGELDVVFQQALDRMESQTRDAIFIDHTLRQLLDQAATDDSIINWDPERAISPKLAFRSLALRLIKVGQGSKTREGTLTPLDYEDLLSWPDAPRRAYGTPAADFLKCIEHARSKRLSDFWVQLRSRIAPASDPQQATINATADLLAAFAIVLPHQFVVPVASGPNGQLIIPFSIRRESYDLEWVVPTEALESVSRALHALATLCHLGGEPSFANVLLELNLSLHNRMRSTLRKYSYNERFTAGGIITIRLQRDNIHFVLTPWIYDQARLALTQVRGLHFISTAQYA